LEAKLYKKKRQEEARRLEVKENLKRYQLEKEASQRVRQREEESKKRPPPSKEQLEQLRLRGAREQARAKEAALLKEKAEAERKARIDRGAKQAANRVKVKRDPGRLTQATGAWEEREAVRKKEEEQGKEKGLFSGRGVVGSAGYAMPSWRQGV